MSNNKERKIPDYLKFPFERYLMVRVEFLILTQNELEAKIMRIIEWAIESRRDELSRKGKDIPDEVWVTIPESIFMDWLYGTVQSETTLKSAIKSLMKKHLIFRQPGGTGRYDALEYTLNKPLISKLFTLFPEKINDIDMASIMKQPRKSKDEAEGQKLAPSKFDPLIRNIRGTIIDPLNSQLLTPSASIIDPLGELGGDQLLTPEKKEETEKESKKESDPLSLSSLSDEDLLAELNRRKTATTSKCEEVIHTEDKLSTIETTTSVSAPAPSELTLTAEESRAFELLCTAFYAVRPKITETIKTHCATLAVLVHNLEEMQSLLDYTRNQEHLKGKTIYLANLVNPNNLNGWKQAQVSLTQASQPKEKEVVTVGNRHLVSFSSRPRL